MYDEMWNRYDKGYRTNQAGHGNLCRLFPTTALKCHRNNVSFRFDAFFLIQ